MTISRHGWHILAENKTNTLTLRPKLLLLLAIFSLWACEQKRPVVEVEGIAIPTRNYRFDKAFFRCSPADLHLCTDSLTTRYFPFFQSGDSAFWFKQRSDSLLNALHHEIAQEEAAITKALEESHRVLQHYAHYFPKRCPSRLYTYVSPLDFQFPLFVTDSLIFVALDQYLGAQSPFYQSQPEYLLRGRHWPFLPMDLAEALAGQQVRRELQGSSDFLSDIIYEGKLLFLGSMLYPEAQTHQWLRYSAEEWAFCEENEAAIWSYLVEQQALFSGDADLKRRLILPAPFSKFYLPIDNQTPGRIGRWVGYRIVESWMEQNNYNVQEMLRTTDARKFLRDAKYKP